MKKIFTYSIISFLMILATFSCEKDSVDPTLPPIIETTSSLDAENKVNLLISEGKNMDFLLDLQEDEIWKACTNTTSNAVYAYGIWGRVIIDMKQKKVDKKLRNVVTVYSIRVKSFADSDYLANIYNNQKIRFYKVTTNVNIKVPLCSTLGNFFSSAEPYGGLLVK